MHIFFKHLFPTCSNNYLEKIKSLLLVQSIPSDKKQTTHYLLDTATGLCLYTFSGANQDNIFGISGRVFMDSGKGIFQYSNAQVVVDLFNAEVKNRLRILVGKLPFKKVLLLHSIIQNIKKKIGTFKGFTAQQAAFFQTDISSDDTIFLNHALMRFSDYMAGIMQYSPVVPPLAPLPVIYPDESSSDDDDSDGEADIPAQYLHEFKT